MTSKTPSFEQSMQELESIVDEMEKGDLSLESALEKFEKGIHLAKTSQKMLKDAEQKVQILMEKSGDEQLVALNTEKELGSEDR